MTKNENKSYDAAFVVFIVVVSIYVGIFITIFSPSFQKGEKALAFVEKRYNFTEEECVERVSYDIRDFGKKYHFVCGYNGECNNYPMQNYTWDKAKKAFLLEYPDTNILYGASQPAEGIDNQYCWLQNFTELGGNREFKCSRELTNVPCSRYCHTKPVQVSENCTNIYILRSELCAFPLRIETNENITEAEVIQLLNKSFTLCERPATLEKKTTCTPIYRNETYGCQSGEDVNKARELIR